MKVSIISEGEGACAAYALGVLDSLYSHYGLKRVDYVAGSSGSLPLLAYYVSGQFSLAKDKFIKYLSSGKVLRLDHISQRKKIIDIDYIVDTIFKKKMPLNTKKLKESKTKFIIPATDLTTGKVRYFNNNSKYDFFEILRAGMAMPFLYNKSVKIGKKEYFDGAYGDPFPLSVGGIKNSKRIIIVTRDMTFINKIERVVSRIFKSKFEKGKYSALDHREGIYKRKMKEIRLLNKDKNTIVIEIKKNYPMFDNRKETLKRLKKTGYSDTVNNKEVAELIETMKKSKKKEFYFSDL